MPYPFGRKLTTDRRRYIMASSSKEPEVLCKECHVPFQSHAAYAAHCKRKMKEGKGHIHCEICGAEFFLRETLTRHHNQVETSPKPSLVRFCLTRGTGAPP